MREYAEFSCLHLPSEQNTPLVRCDSINFQTDIFLEDMN
jgi:hypothetical protein